MRRVLLVGDYPPPYGGLSVQMEVLRHRLAALPGTEVRVLDIGARRYEPRAECLTLANRGDFVAKVLAHARRGFTIHLHTNGHNTKSWIAAFVCAEAGRLNGRRTVLSLGSGGMPPYVENARGVRRALVRAGVRDAGAVIVRNEPGRAAIVAAGAAAGAVRVLPGFYGVGAEEIGRLPGEVRAFVARHRPVLAAVATPGAVYGLALMVDAAARLRPRHPALGLLLLGPDGLEDGCPPWVLAPGEVDRPVLLAALREVDVFVRPTYFDGDASSVREALALGVRVVASDTDFRPAGVRLFPRGDADALAGAVDAALVSAPVQVDSSSLPELLALYDSLGPRRTRASAVPIATGSRRAV